MGISLDTLTFLDPAETEKAKAEREYKKVEDLLPVAESIKNAADRVAFTLDTEGANAELERLRTAARIQGFTLRILERNAEGPITKVVVKTGKLIKRRTPEEIAADEKAAAKAAQAEEPIAEAPKPSKATPGAKSGK